MLTIDQRVNATQATQAAKAAAAEGELRRAIHDLHASIDVLENEIRKRDTQEAAIGAGGVEPLRPRKCLHQIAEPEPLARQSAERDALLQAAIDLVGTITGMTPPPIEVAHPEVFAPFRAFVDRVQEITREHSLAAPAAVAVPSDWRERFADAVYQVLAAADNQDVPLEDYPARILRVLDSVVGPRHPTVVQWRNDAINTCIATAYKYCRDPESLQYLRQDLQALITAPQPPAQAPTESVLIDGIAYYTPAPVAAELQRLNIEAKQPAPAAQSERELFEAHANERGYTLGRGPNGGYQYRDASIAWRAWQAARSAKHMAPQPELSPDFTDTARAALLWVLWHHQGGSSPVGQPIRFALGMGQHDRLNEHQLAEAKRWERLHPANPFVLAQKQDPLTDEQIQEAILPIDPHGIGYFLRIARAIERAHGIT